MRHFRSPLLILFTCALATIYAGCAGAPAVTPGGPTPPITNPNLLGRPNQAVQSIATLKALAACLDAGNMAYGVTTNTTNVRRAPSTAACRLGKLAKATVVEITEYTEVKAAGPATTEPAGPTVGYVEDIQPIFVRACTICHNEIAKTLGLQTTQYDTLMAGSLNGPVVVPGDPDASKLWQYLGIGKMPMIGGPLPAPELALVKQWIAEGAAEHRGAQAAPAGNAGWYTLAPLELIAVPDGCVDAPATGEPLVSADLVQLATCGAPPSGAQIEQLVSGRPAPLAAARPRGASTVTATGAISDTAPGAQPIGATAATASTAAQQGADAGTVGINVAALGLPAPTDSDPYMTPTGFCMERHLPDNKRGITALSFAPDGRLFVAFDSNLAQEMDPLILYDAYHPSRAVAVYDWVNKSDPVEIMTESPRITGLDYADGAVYLSRSGEVGRIPDGGSYEPLAGGFAVQSQLFHANDGIVVADGWVYVSAGGIMDGYVEGLIAGVSEQAAQGIVSGGNPYAARIVRAPLDTLLSTRSISAFATAARGVRNPYGITRDPAGRIWFTDNGATNVPDAISAGDEVNLLDPGAVTGDEGSSLYYGFPLALNGSPPDWYTGPVVTLVNSAAPTGITWAYDTIFFGTYGRFPGLYRLGRAADGSVAAERILTAWPVLAVTTAPDGAVWIGMGDGGLYRITPGC